MGENDPNLDKCVQAYIDGIVSRGVNTLDISGQTALINMARIGRFPMAEKCLKKLLKIPSIKVNHRDHAGRTALMYAVQYSATDSSLECVKALLAHPKIIVNLGDTKHQNTALHLATTCKHNTVDVETIRYLLEAPNINVNLQNCREETALHRLCDGITWNTKASFGLRAVQLLLSHPDIDVNIEDEDGDTALHVLCLLMPSHFDQQIFDVFKLLLAVPHIDVNVQNDYRHTPLTVLYDCERSSKYIDELLNRADICFYRTLEWCGDKVERLTIGQYLLKIICRRLQQNSITELILPSIKNFGEEYVDMVKLALCTTTRLQSFYFMRGLTRYEKLAWLQVTKENFSITDFDLLGLGEVNTILTEANKRNRNALEKCRKAARCTVWAFKLILRVKDMAKMLGKLVWESRGTEVWA